MDTNAIVVLLAICPATYVIVGWLMALVWIVFSYGIETIVYKLKKT